MRGLSTGKGGGELLRTPLRKTLGSKSGKLFRSVIAVILAVAFVPIVPQAALASVTSAGPLVIDTNNIFANGAPITITDDSTAGIDIAWPAGTYAGTTYTAGSYNYTGDDAIVHGGSLNATVSSASITMTSGTVSALYGAGSGTLKTTPGDCTGLASIVVEGGTANEVIGGGCGYSTVADASVLISGGDVTGYAIAGGVDDHGGSSMDNLAAYYKMKAAGGTESATGYADNYTKLSTLTIQGDATVQEAYASGADNTITDTSTLDVLGGCHVGYAYGSFYHSLAYNATVNVSGDNTSVTGAGLLSGESYLGNVDFTYTGGSISFLLVGTLTGAAATGTGQVLGNASISAKDGLIGTQLAIINGLIDGNLSISGNGTYTVSAEDGSGFTAIKDNSKWEADNATILMPNGQSLVIDGQLIADSVTNHGTIKVEDGSATISNMLRNGSDGKINVEGQASLATADINNLGLIKRGETATVSCTNRALHTVTCSSGVGGSMTPQGYVVVANADPLICTLTPETNYGVKAILLDGSAVANPTTSYTLVNVTADHTVAATFGLLYDISLDKTALNFGAKFVGYTSVPAAQTVTITNAGTDTVNITGVTSDSSNFVIGSPSVTELAPAATTTFTVRPISGLAVGDYTANISITTDNATARTVTAQFGVEQYAAQIGTAKYETLQAAFDAAKSGDTVTILKDIELNDSLSIGTAGPVTLTSAVAGQQGGEDYYYTISPSDSFSAGSLISTDPATTTILTLTNINLGGEAGGCRAIYVGNRDSLYIQAGTTISDFSATVSGSTDGSAVYLSGDSVMLMDDGTITNNIAADNGAIYVADTAQFTLSGGTIENNRADGYTGGVYVGNTARFNWNGSGTVADNSITDDVTNDVYVNSNTESSGVIDISGSIKIPSSTVITGTTDEAESFFSVMQIAPGSSYGEMAPTTQNSYLWAEVGGTYVWMPAVAVDKVTDGNIVHGYFSIGDAINLSGDADSVYIYPAALNTQATRTIAIDIVVDHNLSLVNSTGSDLTVVYNKADSMFIVGEDNVLTLNGLTLDIVDGIFDNNGTVSTANGGKLLPTLGVKTQVIDSITTFEGGNASMTFEAQKTGGATTNSIEYQWYECSNAAGGNPVAINGQTESTMEIDYAVGTSGTHYYNCVAYLNGISLGSGICTVSVTPAEVSLQINNPNPSTLFGDLSYGYTNGSTVTYTITNTGSTKLTNINTLSHLNSSDVFSYNFALGFDGTLTPGQSTTVMITSKTGLNAGNHTGIFTVASTEYPDGVKVNLSQYVAPVELNSSMAAEIPDVTYTAHEITPDVHLSYGDQELVQGTDYTVTYSGNINAGRWATATVTAVDGGNFTGSANVHFTITQASLSDAVALPIADQTYTGSEIKPAFTLTYNGVTVPSDGIYTWYYNNTNTGIADIGYIAVHSQNFTILTGGDTTFKIVRTGTSTWTRIAGGNRYETMAKIVENEFKGVSGTVILASGSGYADALSASSLAGLLSAPIITTDSNTLSTEAKSEIERLQATKVYIIGGTASVSSDVEATVRSLPGMASVERIAGANRVDTGVQIYNKWVSLSGYSDMCFIARSTTFPDALSMAPYCYADSSPIFLANSDGTLSPGVKQAVEHIGTVVVLGGTGGAGAISDDTMNSLNLKGTWMRLAGLSGDRYSTSLAITRWATGMATEATIQPHVSAKLSLNNMAIATGENFPDALVSVDMLGNTHSALLLVADNAVTESNVIGFISPNRNLIMQGYVLGGENSVSATVMGWLEEATK